MLVRYGAGVLVASGSIGGAVASHNRFGSYWRARTTPVNPQSQLQNIVRAAVGQLAQRWSNVLTALQRDAWEVYADAIVRQNKLGAQIKLTGFNMYMRSNVGRLQAGATVIDAAPGTLTLAPQDSTMTATVDEAGQEVSVSFDTNLDWNNLDDAHMFLFMSRPHSAGSAFIGGPWRLIGKIDGSSTTAPTSPTIFTVPFVVAEDQQVAVRGRISEDDGRLSDFFRDQSSVSA